MDVQFGAYPEWVAWLDAFGRGDDRPTAGLTALSIQELGPVTARRVSERCGDALNRRLALWSDSFNAELSRASNPHSLRLMLVRSRQQLEPLRALARSDLLFTELRDALTAELDRAIEWAQTELENNVRRDRHARDELLLIILEQPLTRSIRAELGDSTDDRAEPAGRWVLLA